MTVSPGEAATPSTVASGGVAFDGLAVGTTDVAAAIPGFDPLSGNPQTVTVTAPAITMYPFPSNVGAGLQLASRHADLSGTQHGGTTVHLESSDSTMVLFARGRYDAGTSTLDIFVPDGSIFADFYIQTIEGTTGAVTVTATAPGFASAVGTVNVLQPYFRLKGLPSSIDTLDPTDPFYVYVGLPNGSFTDITSQQARGGGPGLAFTVTSSDSTVGLLETTATLDDSAVVVVPPGEYTSPGTVAAGGVAFDGVGPGVTTVTAAAPGFLPVSTGVVDLPVTQPSIAINNLPSVGVGAGLQTSAALHATLSAALHGGVTVHIEVADTNLALISENALDVGGKSVDVFVANGQTVAAFYLEGKEDTTGVITLSASAPGFSNGLQDVGLVQPSVRITSSISGTQDTLDPPDNFIVNVGVASSANFFGQPVRPGAPDVVVTASVDDSLVAELQTLADTSHTVTVNIPAGAGVSASTVALGGVAFKGLSPGVVELSASVPGFSQFSTAIRTITVVAPTVGLPTLGTVGAGLESAAHGLGLSASGHGGVTVHIESLEPELALLSYASADPGQPFIDVFVPDGSASFNFYVHGLEDTTGTATIVASAPLFISDMDSVKVVTPGVRIVDLASTIDVGDAADAFYARVGPPTGNNGDISNAQGRRAGAPPLIVTLISSTGAVADFVKTAEPNDTVTVTITSGHSGSPTTVANGGVALEALASGQTTVTASIPGFITVGTGQKVVDVSNQNIYINGLAARLGKNLQSVAASAELGDPNHVSTTVHVEVSDTLLAVVSANALTAGSRFVDIVLPNGDAEALFYVQALDTGQVTVTASAASYATAMQNVDVVPAGIRIASLADTLTPSTPDDEFVVQVGALNGGGSDIVEPQELRGGGPSRTFTVTSSDGALASIVLGGVPDVSRDIVLDPAEFETPVSAIAGGLVLRRWNAGTITVTASTPDFVTTAAGMHAVVLTGTPTGIGDRGRSPFALDQNVPNPFNPTTTITFSLPSAAMTELSIYDVAGRCLATLISRNMPAGRASVQWDGDDDVGNRVASGVYFYRLRAGENVETRKMVLLK